MKLAIITDIHHGPASHNKAVGWDGLARLAEIVDGFNQAGADVLVDLGDHISDSGHDADIEHMRAVADVLAQFRGRRLHLLGNHDVVNLAAVESAKIFGQSGDQQVLDFDTFRLIGWQPGVAFDEATGFAPAGHHLQWLLDTLDADPRPAIVATHVPISGHSQIGNFYFEATPHRSTYPDAGTIREAIEANGRVAMWLSGHVHWNTLNNIGNIWHLTTQSFSERFTTMPEPAAAHALLTIEGDTAEFEVFGNDPVYARLPFRASGTRRWLTPAR
jgi:3',5'-cyclic-AMP phosphodiesterase